MINEDFERIALQEKVLIEIENLAIQQQEWEEEQRKMIKPAKVIIEYDRSEIGEVFGVDKKGSFA